jgi:hypothetical protein
MSILSVWEFSSLVGPNTQNGTITCTRHTYKLQNQIYHTPIKTYISGRKTSLGMRKAKAKGPKQDSQIKLSKRVIFVKDIT